ncbi:hypothetical protein JMG10_10045 [Nostoc ellipsosporum NOK]|nr:hypothetical protein [Nostoc ellipsosporum NOK]
MSEKCSIFRTNAQPNDPRWAVAFRARSFAFTDAQAREGERLWKADPGLRQRLPDPKTLVALTPAAFAGSIGEARADAVLAFPFRYGYSGGEP